MVLRCIQSSGSNGTVALSNGVVSDFATRAERGSYIGLASLGSSLGPTLGPLIGGLLTKFLGWRAIFWFLDIYGGVMLLVVLIIVPETCRNVVGNGSVSPQRWNYSLISYLHRRKQIKAGISMSTETISHKRCPGIFSALRVVCSLESFSYSFTRAFYMPDFTSSSPTYPYSCNRHTITTASRSAYAISQWAWAPS